MNLAEHLLASHSSHDLACSQSSLAFQPLNPEWTFANSPFPTSRAGERATPQSMDFFGLNTVDGHELLLLVLPRSQLSFPQLDFWIMSW